jgi:hypothetical protein
VVRDIDEETKVGVGEPQVLHPVLPSRSRLATQTHTMGRSSAQSPVTKVSTDMSRAVALPADCSSQGRSASRPELFGAIHLLCEPENQRGVVAELHLLLM